MSAKRRAVFGIYSNQSDAENGANNLKMAGFRATDISMMFPENGGAKDLAITKSTKTPEGTVLGACFGIVAGAAMGWLVGGGLVVIPGLVMFAAAGPWVSLLSGVGAGAVVGGLPGAVIGLVMPEFEAKRYEGRVRKGGILLSVHCDDTDWNKTARMVLEQTGAENVSSASEARADFAVSDRPRPRTLERRA